MNAKHLATLNRLIASFVIFILIMTAAPASRLALAAGAWETVGTAGFSAGEAQSTSLALDSSGISYMAYSDYGNDNKAAVMKLGLPPEIEVWDGGTEIADGSGFVYFGATTIGTPITKTFTVTNTGEDDLILTEPISVSGDFTVTTFGDLALSTGESTTFQVTLSATATGSPVGELSFGNNDSDETPFNFAIGGEVEPAPAEIEVRDGTTDIPDGSGSVNFGTTVVGAPITKTFTVANTGGADLIVTGAINVPEGFTLTNWFGDSTLSSGESTTFQVTLSAGAMGSPSGEVSFANTDSDENPFNFTVSGTVATRPTNVYVDDDYATTPPEEHTFGYDAFATIQEGIEAVAEGGTVNVAAGEYDGTLNIVGRQNITIDGANKATTIIKPSTAINWELGYGAGRKTAIRVEASTGITLQDFTVDLDLIKGNNVSAYLGWNSTGTIANNIFQNSSLPDIVGGNPSSGSYYELSVYLRAPDYTDESRATFSVTDNTFHNMGRVAIITHDYLTTSISGNTFYKDIDDFGYGIEMGSTSDGTISNNTFYGFDTPAATDNSSAAGIYVENAFTNGMAGPLIKNVTITNNDLYGNQYAMTIGNEFDGYAGNVDIHLTATGNHIHDNLDGGVIVTDEDKADGSSVNASFSGNTVENNGEAGYFLYTYGDGDLTVLMDGETIRNQQVGIKLEDGASGTSASSYNIDVQNSQISGNTTYAIQNAYDATTLQADENWWGSLDPDWDSLVSGNVSYNPWFNTNALTTKTYLVGAGEAFTTIQSAIDAASAGDTIDIAAGTYAENVIVNKSVTLAGTGAESTIVIPAVSNPNPCSNSSLCGGAASSVLLVQANDVVIHDLTVDGDNPALTSGIVRAGADLDARNGIIVNSGAGTFTELEVYNNTVRNIYLRGIQASSGGTFNFHGNTVNNVQGDSNSIGMFAWYGPGIMSNNTVSYANDGISANHSKGIQFLNNTVTHSGSGVHTDNAGDSAGSVADLIQDNTVTDCTVNGNGVWVFVPYIAPTVNHNTITNCSVGLSAWGQGSPVVTAFTNNTVNGPSGAPESVGAYITTDWISWGYSDISVTFTGNIISGNETGVYLTADQQSWNPEPYVASTINATFLNNQIVSNTTGMGKGTDGTYNVSATSNWWGDASGPGAGNTIAAGIAYDPWCTDASCTTVTSTAPTVVSITRQNGNPSNRTTVFFLVTFSESVTGVNAADFALTTTGDLAGASIASVSGNGATRMIGVNTGTGSGTLRLDVLDDDSIKDANLIPLDGAFNTGEEYTIDKTAPTVIASTRQNANPTSRGTVFFLVTFSESVTGVNAADFALTTTGDLAGVSIASVTGSGTTRTVSVNTGSGSGTLRLDVLDDDTIKDAIGNLLEGAFTAGQEYIIDRTAPEVISVTRLNSNPTNRSTVFFLITFSESVTGVNAADFALSTTGDITGASIASVSGSGSGTTRMVSVNTGTGSGNLRLDVVNDNTIKDAAGNPLDADFLTGQEYIIDKTAPLVSSITRLNGELTHRSTVFFLVTFSESVTGVNAADFALTITGDIAGASLSSISGSGATRTVGVNTGSGNGTLRLDLVDDDTIKDAIGNPLGGAGNGNGNFLTGQEYTVIKP